MRKYLLVATNSLQEYFAYRLNFLLWRVRVIVSILLTYFLWQAIFEDQKQIFGYNRPQMLTYILLLIFTSSIVLSTRTFRVAEYINLGRLSNFLLLPVNFFGFMLAKDIADKIINTVLSVIEMILLFLLFSPPIIIQTEVILIALFVTALILAVFLYFEIGLLLSFIGFWSKETWAPQFIFFILVTFLAGTYFPLDIFPPTIYNFLQLLPFTYLVFFPLKIYLGAAESLFVLKGFFMLVLWIFILWFLLKYIWRRGLKIYTAEGQ